jgi:hypothetical protein
MRSLASRLTLKRTGLLLRLLVVAAMVLSIFAFNIQPISAAATVTEQLSPAPPEQLLNTGGFTQLIWYEVTFTSSPRWILHTIEDPTGTVIETHSENITGRASPIYNPEDTFGYNGNTDPSGTHQGDGDINFAHTWDCPAGAMPGQYTSRVRYYSSSIGGNPPGEFNWEAESAQRFFVTQPLSIMKYNDVNGNGAYNSEPGLESWSFNVTGPGWTYNGSVASSPAPGTTQFDGMDLTPQFPLTGYHLFINSVDVGTYTLSMLTTTTGTIVLDTPLGGPPSAGDTLEVSFPNYAGTTDVSGLIELPNIQQAGDYTVTETMQPDWINTDPSGSAPVQKVVHIPADIGTDPGDISPTNPVVRFGNRMLTPGTILTLSADPTYLPEGGGSVTFDVREHNSGDLALHNVVVTGTSNVPGWTTFTLDNVTYPVGVVFSGDTGNDGVLGVNETWHWTVTLLITANAHFAASADGITPAGVHVSPDSDPAYPLESDTLEIPVNPPPPEVPASSNLGIAFMVFVMAGAVTYFVYRKNKQVRS